MKKYILFALATILLIIFIVEYYNQSSEPQILLSDLFIRFFLSDPLIPVVRHARLSEPQYEPIYNIYPSLQQNLTRTITLVKTKTKHLQ